MVGVVACIHGGFLCEGNITLVSRISNGVGPGGTLGVVDPLPPLICMVADILHIP